MHLNDSDEETIATLVIFIVGLAIPINQKLKNKVRGLLRWNHGCTIGLVLVLTILSSQKMCKSTKFLRMTLEDFEESLGLSEVDITENNTNMHNSIPAIIELAAKIRYLDNWSKLFWSTVSIQGPCNHTVKVHSRSTWHHLQKVKRKIFESKLICIVAILELEYNLNILLV